MCFFFFSIFYWRINGLTATVPLASRSLSTPLLRLGFSLIFAENSGLAGVDPRSEGCVLNAVLRAVDTFLVVLFMLFILAMTSS